MLTLRFETRLFVHTAGESSWFFVSVPPDESERIRELPREPRPGFGSVRVSVTIGGSTWRTSVFPESKTATYLLPVKKAVRSAEGIDVGDGCRVELEVLE